MYKKFRFRSCFAFSCSFLLFLRPFGARWIGELVREKLWSYLHNTYTFFSPTWEKFQNFFLEMTSLEVKICEGIRIWYFQSEKCFPDSGKAYYVLKRKVTKMQFLLKTIPFGVKMCGKRKSIVFRPKYVIFASIYSFS